MDFKILLTDKKYRNATIVMLVTLSVLTAAAGATYLVHSNEVSVNVGAEVTVLLNDPQDGTVGQPITFTGQISNNQGGIPLVLQMSSGGDFSTVETGTTATDGSFSITYVPTIQGTLTFQVVATLP